MAKQQDLDLDLNFIVHPVRKDIAKKVDEEAVKQSVKNLVLTKYFERPFQPELGCGVHSLLFDNMTPITTQNIKRSIEQVINNYEPRVELLNVDVVPKYEQNTYEVTIVFALRNRERPVTLVVILERTR